MCAPYFLCFKNARFAFLGGLMFYWTLDQSSLFMGKRGCDRGHLRPQVCKFKPDLIFKPRNLGQKTEPLKEFFSLEKMKFRIILFKLNFKHCSRTWIW